MVRYYCDCCGKEIGLGDFDGHVIPFRVHIFNEEEYGHYIDRDFNTVSGRNEDVEACTKCYNRIMGTAKKEMDKIKEENNIDQTMS